ncbi:retrotransposon protein, putative, ty1-copia subclass [Tanacetum coccineum]
MASPKASISKSSKKPKFTIIPPKQLFTDLTNEDTITPSPKLQESSPSAPNAPSKTTSTKDTSSSSIDYTPKSPTSSTSLSPNGYLNPPTSPPPRVSPPPPTQENASMDITLTLSPITPLNVQFDTLSPSPPIFVEKKLSVIEQHIPPAHAADSEAQVLAEWNAVYDAHNEELKSIFEKQAGVEWFDLIETFHACKQEEGKSVSSYVLEMKGYVEQLECLGYVFPQDLSVGLIMNDLTNDFAGFVWNYNMHNIRKTIGELYALLIEYGKGLPKKAATPQVMAIQGATIHKANKKSLNAKWKGKGKGKGKDKSYIPKPKNPKPSAKEHPVKYDAYHHCKEVGHWKRNCPVYHVELVMKKKQVGTASSSSIFTIELFSFPNKSWVYDIGCGTHICNTKQGLRGLRKLKQGSKNDVLYFNAIPCNGIYETDMLNLVPNVNSIYYVSDKRVKHNLDSTYLWHCSLAHISKKHIEKLQHDGLLKSTDEESFDKCVSCLSGKMRRKPFPHRTERANDLLGLIHTDVRGPLRHVFRQGASYFITITDDYSRYGYVYLLKHKHEVFETFKVFKNEVENQLEKTIKALRSDQGGEYISQEYKDYLKACGIIQQLTPPYILQHNDVFERRNRTLLDMVRSMMNLITLPLSFWDYALVFAHSQYGSNQEGCETLVKRDTPDKLQQRYVKCIFIGYPKETMGYNFYFPPENKIVVARYVEFLEKKLISQEVSGRAVELEEIQDEDASPSENTSEIPMEVEGFKPPQEEVVPVRRFARTHQASDHLCLNVDVEEYSLGDLNESTNYKAALLDPESDKWVDAMNAEMQSKKVYQGYTQTYGIDYEETFSPVADIIAIRILIAIAAFYDYEIWKMDVKTVFLNGYLDKDIYMVQTEGFIDPKHPRKVCKLQGSIFGLKQALRSWNKRFDEEIKKIGFAQNLDEPCVYQKASGSNVTFFILYVDDIIIMGNHIISLQSVRMDNSKHGNILIQERFDLNETQGASTTEEVKRMTNVPYASAVGSITYAVICTRPDVAFAQNITSSFQQNSGEPHWSAVKTILKYLKNTKDMFLVYGGNPEAELRVDCYCDAGFETDKDDIKSQIGYVFILNGGAVDWKSSKQSTTAMSATKAEYIAASEAVMEVVWIRKFISGLGIVPTINEPIKMFCDNSAALHFANEPGVQKGARHDHRRYHYVRECIELGEINLLKVRTNENLSDSFTKALPKGKLTQHDRSMRLRLASSFM